MTDKPTVVLKDAVIHDGMITGVTTTGANITRRVLHQENATVEVSDFIFVLEDYHAPSIAADVSAVANATAEKAKEMVEGIREKIFPPKPVTPVDHNTTVEKNPS